MERINKDIESQNCPSYIQSTQHTRGSYQQAMTKRLPPEVKLSRKPTRVACTFCHSKHLQCDESRPCKNCVKRGVSPCVDSVRKRTRRGDRRDSGGGMKMEVEHTVKEESVVKMEKHPEQEPQEKNVHPGDGGRADEADPLQGKVKRKRGRPAKGDVQAKDGPVTKRKYKPREKKTAKGRGRLDQPVPKEQKEQTNQQNQQNQQIQQNQQHLPPIPSQSHLPLLNLANVSLSGLGLNTLTPTLPSFSNIKSPVFERLPFSPNINMPIADKDRDGINNFSLAHPNGERQEPLNMVIPPSINVEEAQVSSSVTHGHQSPGSPLTFSVSSSHSRTNTNKSVSQSSHPLLPPPDEAFSDMNLKKNIVSSPASPISDEFNFINQQQQLLAAENLGNNADGAENNSNNDGGDEDDDTETRPYIIINLENGTMVSSYPDNSTPNSYAYNADHSQMPNTAKEIPKDFEQNDDYTSPLIMRHVIKQPDDIYLTNVVKAYQYPKAYHALIAYLKKRFNNRQLLEIAKCMAKYRPSFISATKNLYENDLIFTERSFQRTLLEYENLISMSPSPTIIWRRTGEIVALTNEFAVMTGYSKMSLLTKRTFIVELMDDESTINYFRSFSEFAFGDLNATHLTDCNLRKADDNNYLRCCCVWTIKRDVFDIPMLIVGQFLPVLD